MPQSDGEQAAWWEAFRDRMPVVARWAFFDHAAVAPLSGPAKETLHQWTDDVAANGPAVGAAWGRRIEDVRRLAAQMVAADTSEMAFVANTTHGISLVAEGYPWRQGDNVIIFEGEFPSNLYPWMNLESRGVEVRWVKTDGGRFQLDELQRACDANTRIVAVSWVGYSTGWRNDLDELAELVHRRGALLFVDAIQGLGVFPLDVQKTPIDFFAADGHKWLLGPEGAGVLFIRRGHLELLRPLGLGWNSVRHASDYNRIDLDLRDTAARYEGGSYNMPGIVALGASLELLASYDQDDMARRVCEVSQQACQCLQQAGAQIQSDRSPKRQSGIVAFDLPTRDPETVRRQCRAAGVKLSCRGGRLRISPHAYNNDSDIERLIEVLKRSD